MRRLNCLLALSVVLLTCALAAGQCSPCTIWPSTTTPTNIDSGDGNGTEAGMRFRSDSAGYVTGIRFYKSAANVGVHVGNLWTNSGTLLASAQFSNETASGWQQVNFGAPVPVSAATTYVVSYFAPSGHYSYDGGFFNGVGVDNPPLHALADGIDGSDGVYLYTGTSAFPTQTFNSTNYWVDVVFVPQGSTAPPTVAATIPANLATGVSPVGSLSASFSEAMDPTSITSSSFQLFDPNNNPVAGSVSYSVAGVAASFQPSASLAFQTTYRAVVRGSVRDFLGNSMGGDFSWTFTTGNGPSNKVCPCTIWPSNSSPSLTDGGDGSSIEVGVKFRADVNGFVTGVRFYKGAANTGTHIGNLWTVGGTLLASAVFTGESASGWQQVNFATPVAITGGTTYVASYYAPVGHYSWDEYQLAAGVDNAPLHALSSSSSGGNGVYISSPSSAFPTITYSASGYGVDLVYLLQNSTTPPVIVATNPGSSATGVALGGTFAVQFNEPMDPATITSSGFQLVDSSNNVVPTNVTYAPATESLTFQPVLSLTPQTVYTATVYSSVHDALGNSLSSNYSWSFTTAPPPGDSGPGGPILVISSAVNPFSSYLGEILLNEGLNEFRVKDISTVTPTVLSQYDVAILGEFALTSSQASMINSWVTGGGSLIAMRPDHQLAGLLGVTPTGATLSNQYMLVNTRAAPGAGIYGQTMQFHGTADLYTLSGAASLASLYSTQSTATGSPALTLANAGAGQAAAFTYDLARSVVFTRQGNPAWSGQQRDPDLDTQIGGLDGGTLEIRASDLFYGNASFDPEPDWVNLNTVQVPQADEQQRLFTNLIQMMNARRKPLPRFWYLPDGYKAAVIMTGDDHGGNGTQPRFDTYVAESPANCSLADWTCVRATSYVFPVNVTFNPPTSYTSYIAEGFEIANHTDNAPTCSTFTAASLDASITAELALMTQFFPLAPASQTNRTHCVLWSDYDTEPGILLNHGIRLDTSYYDWPDAWVQDRPGLFTGSGLPMRYADRNGNTFNVYQATTQFPDETTWNMPADIDTILQNATGPLGFYAVLTANMHTDHIQDPESNTIVAGAQSFGVPVIAAQQMLTWLDGRNNSAFGNMSWASNALSFTVTAATGSHGLEVMIPATSAAGPLVVVLVNGVVQPFALQTVKGLQYATFLTTGGAYQAVYGQSYSVSGTISGPGGNGATVTIAAGTASATTTASASGAYTFTGVPNGVTYTVTPSKTGYTFTPASQTLAVNGANVNGVNFATVVTTFSLSGTISGAGGNGATVTLSGAATATTTASTTGTYAFAGLANGAYTVTPSKAGYSFSPTSQAATVNGANLTVNFSSTAVTYSISGTISGAGGNGASVSLNGAATATTLASATGTYTFLGLGNGAYTVTPSRTGYTFSPTSQAATVNGANLTVNFSSAAVTYSLSGTISGPGGNGATVTLSGAGTGTTTASSTGTYTFSGLANGAYAVTPSMAGYAYSPTNQAATVNGANLTGVNFSSTVGLTAVSLSTYYNIYAIATSGNAPKSGGLDGSGDSYNSSTLGLTATYQGITYTLGPANAPDGVNAITIPVAGSGYSQLYLLGSASYGEQSNQSIVVTYSDGSSSTLTQSISDWWSPQNLPGETNVTAASNIVTTSGAIGNDPVDLYGYTFNLTAGKTAASVKLPANRNVVFLAVGLGSPTPTAAMPAFNPLPGTFSPSTSVTLSDTTPGAVIHYTTNNTAPSAASPVYSAAIPVTATTTIQAIAVAPGYNNSPVATGTYTIATYSISGTISGAGGNGATVTLSGASAATTTASSTGTYTFAGLANGAYTVTPSMTGYTFSPTSQAATVSGANLTVNFSSSAVTYSISGTISGLGGNGATVTLSGAGSATTTASSTGTYTFPAVTNGAYTVTPSKSGYTFTPGSQSATVNGANLTGVNFSSATATYSISGTIGGAGGNGATVTLSGAGTGTTTASSTGTFTFSGVANGAYTVTPSKSGFTFTPSSSSATVSNANVTGVNFATVTYSISGTISGLGGNGATVTLSGAVPATTTASSTGTFTFSGLTNGAYTVTPSKSGYTFTPASLGATVSNANLTGVNFATVTYTISGTISGAGGNAATVALSGAATATATASSTGTYSFPGLVNGAYSVTPTKTGYSFSPTSQSATVNGANLTVNFSSATATFSISGTITGAGATGATVLLNGTSTATTTASSSGTYSFPGLANGNYSVTPVMTGYNYSPTSQVIALNGANVAANFSSTVLAAAVSLSSYYNVYGIATIGNAPKSGGFDNDSYAFNSNILGTSLTYQNQSFTMGAANGLDAVDNKTITLPSGQYGKLFLLGAGVNGNQTNQPVVVTYSDGNTTTFTQNFSDWATAQNYTGETVVSANASRIGSNGQSSTPAVNIYGYTFILNPAKTVSSVKLPANRNVVFVGVGVGSPTPTPITPYVQVNGAAWVSATTATVAHGSTVNLGPQPLTGTWSWIGPSGFTSTAREIDTIPLSTGVNVFVATYTSGNGAQTVQPFVITSN